MSSSGQVCRAERGAGRRGWHAQAEEVAQRVVLLVDAKGGRVWHFGVGDDLNLLHALRQVEALWNRRRRETAKGETPASTLRAPPPPAPPSLAAPNGSGAFMAAVAARQTQKRRRKGKGEAGRGCSGATPAAEPPLSTCTAQAGEQPAPLVPLAHLHPLSHALSGSRTRRGGQHSAAGGRRAALLWKVPQTRCLAVFIVLWWRHCGVARRGLPRIALQHRQAPRTRSRARGRRAQRRTGGGEASSLTHGHTCGRPRRI